MGFSWLLVGFSSSALGRAALVGRIARGGSSGVGSGGVLAEVGTVGW